MEIADYIHSRGTPFEVAERFTGRIVDQCERIGEVPFSGVAREDLGEGFRMRAFERSAVILYRVTDQTVEIVDIFYGGRDYEALLRD